MSGMFLVIQDIANNCDSPSLTVTAENNGRCKTKNNIA